MAQLVLTQQAVFDKPIKNRHLRPLYLKGYVNGKPLTKMFVDGGAAINIMPYTTFRKLGMTNEELLKTDMVLRDFAGNPSDTRGAIHVELTIGSKTLITTFFVIDGKGHIVYSWAEIGSMLIAAFLRPCIKFSFNGLEMMLKLYTLTIR